MFEKLSNEAYELLDEILEHETEKDYWKTRFKELSNRDDTILRGCFKELREKNMISVNWADNIPYRIQVLKDGYLYEKHIKEIDEQSGGEKKQMKDYERFLKKIIPKARKDDLSVLMYEYEQGERVLIEKLRDEGLIKSVRFMGMKYVGFDFTYDGYHYFDEQNEMNDITAVNVRSNSLYDVFLSHASADKMGYVEELKQELEKLGINVFYDKDSIGWGDKWKDKILEGTQKAEFAIIVISENFFGREWTEKELNEFLARQNDSGQKIILPILHGITVKQLEEQYPDVADIQGISTEDYSKEQIVILFAKELIKRLKGI